MRRRRLIDHGFEDDSRFEVQRCLQRIYCARDRALRQTGCWKSAIVDISSRDVNLASCGVGRVAPACAPSQVQTPRPNSGGTRTPACHSVTGADLLAELQSSLGAAYTFDRELGGGGMARVFLAHERGLGRPVVIKHTEPRAGRGDQRRSLRARDQARGLAAAGEHRSAALRRSRRAVRLLHDAVRRGTLPPRPACPRQRRCRSAKG